MRRGVEHGDDGLGDVGSGQRSVAGVDRGGFVVVPSEADIRKTGLHRARCDGTGFDGGAVQIGVEPFGEGVDGGFGGAVDVAARISSLAGNRAEIDDVGGGAFFEMGQQGAGDVEEPFDVGVDHRIPLVDIPPVDRLKTQCQTGVVDEDIDGGLVQQSLDLRRNFVGIAHVKSKGIDSSVGLGAYPLFQFGQFFCATSGQYEVQTHFGQIEGKLLTDAGGGSGDEGGFVLDVVGHGGLLCVLSAMCYVLRFWGSDFSRLSVF